MRIAAVLLVLGLVALTAPARARAATCSPATRVLQSPRAGSKEVQAKGLNDRGDVVGFADARDGSFRAILWRGGRASRAIDLGVLPGYVSSEAYGVNDDRVVFGLLYDRRERVYPFRWRNGRMTLLRDHRGLRRQAAGPPDRNAINGRGQIAATLLVAGRRRAVRWSPGGRATLLPALPGHTQTNAWGIGEDGVVSGWSRRLPTDDGENNPVLWTRSGRVTALRTAPGRADGAAEATNRSGLTVGYLGTLGTDAEPESDQAAVWPARGAGPRLLGPADPLAYAELVDVNARGQAAGMTGRFAAGGFTVAEPAIWRPGWPALRSIPVPAVARRGMPVVVTQLQDVNARGAIAGNVFGLTAPAFDALRRITPVVWRCPF